jgi:hypothetical protein
MKSVGLPAAILMSFPSEDQFGQAVRWDLFEKLPKVLVFAGQDASKEATAWGTHFQSQFNPNYKPRPDHLQVVDPAESVKVVAVASLPDVPSLFRGLFRSGFKKESANWGMVLDFSSRISKHFGYSSDSKKPMLAILPPGAKEAITVEGSVHEASLRDQVDRQIKQILDSKVSASSVK